MNPIRRRDREGKNVPAGLNRGVPIGPAYIGDGCPVFIIAEAGVNHNGSIDQALELVDTAARVGADAVKFQAFTAEALTTADVATAAYQSERSVEWVGDTSGGTRTPISEPFRAAALMRRAAHARCARHECRGSDQPAGDRCSENSSTPILSGARGESTQRRMLERLELSTPQFEQIAARCRQQGIIFLATPFSVADVERLVRIGIEGIKIASTDIVDLPLLERACRTGLPLILSTGAADGGEIADAVAYLRRLSAAERLVLMHCVSCYPTPLGSANLAAIGTLKKRFDAVVGYSDHTTSTATGAWAVCAGACVLEKHFTLDSRAAGPDHAMSLEPEALADYILQAREAYAALGSGELAVQPIEREVRELGRKRVVAARDIAAGEPITIDTLISKRCRTGLAPTEIGRLVGKRAVTAIAADTAVTLEMVR